MKRILKENIVRKLLFILMTGFLLTSQVYAQKSPTPEEVSQMLEDAQKQDEMERKYCKDSIMYENEATRDHQKAREIAKQCKTHAGMNACLSRFGEYCE